MDKPTILIASADQEFTRHLQEKYSSESNLQSAQNEAQIIELLNRESFDLMILDNDSLGLNALEFYKKVKGIREDLKLILISPSVDVPVAVTAAKLGITDLLHKPVEDEALINAIRQALLKTDEMLGLPLDKVDNNEWFFGCSAKLNEFLLNIRKAGESAEDILLLTGPGIDNDSVIQILHHLGKGRRKLIVLNLESYEKSSTEEHFWLTIQEVLQERWVEPDQEGELCGTLVLKDFEKIETHFKMSILDFLKNRKTVSRWGKLDKGIRIVLPVIDLEKLRKEIPSDKMPDFFPLHVPLLMERKEDLPILISIYVDSFARKFNKKISGISFDFINLLSYYNFPGNFEELRLMLKQAVLNSNEEVISINDLPIDFNMLVKSIFYKLSVSPKTQLEYIRPGFEKEFLKVILQKVKNDEGFAARFLDIPKPVLTAKLEEMGV